MENSETLSMGAKIGIVVGSLLVVAIVAWTVKHYMNKRRTKLNTKVKNEQRLMQMNSRENLVGKQLGKGDMERGHFREMTISRSNSPAPSYVLAPAAAVVNWGDPKSIHSATSSVIELPRSRDGSIVSSPAMPKRPSPLRLNPSDVPLNSRKSTISSCGGSYMPPLPPPRSARGLANQQASNGWISPLDVHFSRPTTPQRPSSRPQSHFPQLQFPEQAESALLVPTPAVSVGGAINSEVASIVSSNAATASEPPPQRSPTFNFNFFDSEVPNRPSRKSTRSIFPATNDDEHPSSRRSGKVSIEISVPIPNLPQNFFGPGSPGLDPNQYGEEVIIRDSIVSKRSVSIYQPSAPHTPTEPSHLRVDSRVASSIYSTAPSLIDTNPNFNPVSISRPASPSQPNTTPRSRSRSTSSKRPTSTYTLSRTQNSLRRHSRKPSVTDRRSRERDQVHYDPTSHHRNRSGSVQGRSVDFDHPRESPFSNADAMTHSAESSVSTTGSAGIPWQAPEPEIGKPSVGLAGGLTVGILDSDRLSVATGASRRGRSASEASQYSMGFGDFYDSYFRQSGLGRRASQASIASQIHVVQNNGARGSGAAQDLYVEGVGVAITSNANFAKRPVKFGGVQVAETIIEVASPLPSPGVGMHRFESFPSRI